MSEFEQVKHVSKLTAAQIESEASKRASLWSALETLISRRNQQRGRLTRLNSAAKLLTAMIGEADRASLQNSYLSFSSSSSSDDENDEVEVNSSKSSISNDPDSNFDGNDLHDDDGQQDEIATFSSSTRRRLIAHSHRRKAPPRMEDFDAETIASLEALCDEPTRFALDALRKAIQRELLIREHLMALLVAREEVVVKVHLSASHFQGF